MAKYRCLPRIIEAVQFFPGSPIVLPKGSAIHEKHYGGIVMWSLWPDPVVARTGMSPPGTPHNGGLPDVTEAMVIHPGDWIITNEEGHWRVVTDRVFRHLYEPVPDGAGDQSTGVPLAQDAVTSTGPTRPTPDFEPTTAPSPPATITNAELRHNGEPHVLVGVTAADDVPGAITSVPAPSFAQTMGHPAPTDPDDTTTQDDTPNSRRRRGRRK